MSILQLPTALVGQGGLKPATKKFVTTDDLATITTPGYLNFTNLEGYTVDQGDILETLYSYNQQTNSSSYGEFSVSITNGVITLSTAGGVILPVVSGDFAVFSGTGGTISDAGYSASNASKTKVVMANGATVANEFTLFSDTTGTVKTSGYTPSDSSKSKVVMANGATVANQLAVFADINGTVKVDGGTAANLTGDLTATGTLTGRSGVIAGASGTAASVTSLPSSPSNGSLKLTATNAGGNFNTTISNGTMGQSTVYTLPDPAGATGNFAIASSSLVNNNLVKANGTAGLIVDAGIASSNVQLKSSIKAGKSGNVGGGGTAFVTVSVAECTTSSIVIPGISSSSSPVYVISIQALNGSFELELSANPGVVCFIDYIIFIAPQ